MLFHYKYLFLVFFGTLYSWYFLTIPENGFDIFQHPQIASWLFGLVLGLLACLVFFVIRNQKTHQSFLRSQLNINALTNTKSKAMHANQAKSQFLATISHEIRNPMQAIFGIHEVLMNQANLSKPHQKLLASAYQASKGMLEILNQVLDISKIEAGKFVVTYTPTNLSEFLSVVTNTFQALAFQRNNRITYHLDKAIAPSLFVNQLHLRQIFQNLISNSVKFTQHGQIHIAARILWDSHAEQMIEFHISDSGIGISQKDLPRVTSPFEQFSPSINQSLEGSGLGLAITQHLLGAMGSELLLESEEGLGTSASFRLRFKRCSNAAPANQQAKVPLSKYDPKSHFKLHILVVDDYLACRETICLQLKQLGHRVEMAQDANEALSKSTVHAFDLVITDESMPKRSGTSLAEELHAKNANLKIILLTGYAQNPQTKTSSIIHSYLMKPVSTQLLAKAIDDLFIPPKRWSLLALQEFTRADLSSNHNILRAILTTHGEMIERLNQAPLPTYAELSQMTHKLQGGARLIQATPLLNLCDQWPEFADDNYTLIIPPIQQELDALHQELQEYLLKNAA